MACDPNFSPDGRSIFNTDRPGTDLNRNFPCAWGEGVGTGTWLQGSSLPFWETYIGDDHFLLEIIMTLFKFQVMYLLVISGAAPASEPETKAMMDFLHQHQDDIEVKIF